MEQNEKIMYDILNSPLKKIGLIKCINQWHHRSRFYSLTDDGKKILEKIKEIER